MQQKKQPIKLNIPSQKQKPTFTLKFATLDTQQKPRRIMSLNRLNYPQNLQKDGTFVAKKDILEHQLFDHHIVKTNMKIQSELKKLHVAFIHQKIPQFYAYYFMNRLTHVNEQKLEDYILKQLQQIKTKRSYYHVIINSIKARQGCLKQLQRCIDNLFNNQQDNLTKHIFREQMMHYRKLTGFVISHIRSWKQTLNRISSQIEFTTFLYQGEDYLIKLLNDCEFIFNSFLTKHLKFSYRNDPYIMRPYADGKQSKYLDIFKYDEEEKANFMIDLNYLAGERAKYLQNKINSKNQKIKEIQKIYQYRDVPLNSIIVKKHINIMQNKQHKEDKQEIQEKQEKQGVIVDNFVTNRRSASEKKLKLIDISKKNQKIKKIKQVFGKTSDSYNRLINQNMFETIGGSQSKKFVSPYEEKLRYSQFHEKKAKFQTLNFESDFENLLRKKQLQVLKGGDNNFQATKTQRSFKNVKIKDNLSDSRKFITKQESVGQLQKILNQLDTFSPQKLQNFRLKKKEDPASSTLIKLNEGKPAKSRLTQPPKTLLQHNQQVYVSLRNQVIQQIQKGLQQKQFYQQKRKQQNQQIQNLLQKKIKQQSLKILKQDRTKKLQGRQNLAKQMSSSQLFGYGEEKINNSQKLTHLQQELRKQMQLKWLRQVQEQLKRKTELNQLQNIKNKKQKQLNKKIQKVKQKQQLEKRYQQIQRQQRAKATKQLLELDEQRKKQIEQQMKQIIQRQKQSMQRFAAAQKSQVQKQLKQAFKVQMLQNIKKQNDRFYDDMKKQQQIKKKQDQFRDQVRSKIQEEYKVGQIMKKNRQRQNNLAKIRLVKQKLGQFDSPSKKNEKKNLQKSLTANVNQENVETIKSKITEFPDFRESIFPKYKKNTEAQKKKLREQFQLQLFAFRKPQNYEEINNEDPNKIVYEEGKFPIKDFKAQIDKQLKQFETKKQNQGQQKQKDEKNQNKKVQDDSNIEQLQLSLSKNQQKLQEQQAINIQMRSSVNSDKFTKFSQKQQQNKARQKNQQDQLIRLKLGMAYQQYQVYKKKKNAINAKRDIQSQAFRKKVIQDKKVINVIDQFQRMDKLGSQNNQIQLKQNNANVQEIKQLFPDNLSVTNLTNINKSKEENQKRKIEKIEEQDLQQIDYKARKNKYQGQQKKHKKNNHDNEQILTINSRLTAFAQKRFATSGEDSDNDNKAFKKRKSPTKHKNRKKQASSEQQQKYQQKQDKKSIKSKLIQQQQQIPPKPTVTTTKIRQIPINSLSQFFTDHFEHLPKLIKKINIYKKQQLIKFLLQHTSFTILQYIKDSVSIGLGIILLNQNKNKYRSLNIIHLGSYDQNDYLDLLINIVRYGFRKDPCQQITMSNIYDKEINEQWQFIKQFEKKFDPYGAIFQKKIFNTQFQRKFVLRRNIGEVCKVQTIPQFNRGSIQLQINTIVVNSSKQQQVNKLLQADNYQQIGYEIGYYGILAQFISTNFTQQALATIIAKSTSKDSTTHQKNIAAIAKLSLSLKKNHSYHRLDQLTQQKFDNVMNLNLQLMSKNQPAIAYPPDQIQNPLSCTWSNYKIDYQLCYDFYSATIPIKITDNKYNIQDQQYMCRYLRYVPNKKNKMFVLTSKAYSTQVTVLPCKNNKYKIFIMDPHQYQGINKDKEQKQRTELGVYIRIFFANLAKHEAAEYDHIWLPEIHIKSNKNQITNLSHFVNTQQKQTSQQPHTAGIIKSIFNLTYTDYLGNSLKVQPSHRDLVITPPFIIGILNMQIETCVEGSPVYVQRIGKKELSWVKEIKKRKNSD